MSKKLSVIVPMYNEEKTIEQTANTLHIYMEENFEDYELIFVDDGSLDNSAKKVEEQNLSNVKIVSYYPNRGKGFAVRQGMLEAVGDIAIFMDADLAYGTDVIKKAADMLESSDANVLVGSRALHSDGYSGYGFLRKVASKAYLNILCIYGGLKLSDSQCGFKAYKGEAVRNIFSKCETDGFAFDFETILWAQKLGYKFLQMPVKIVNNGTSKVHIVKDSLEMLAELRRIKKRIAEIN